VDTVDVIFCNCGRDLIETFLSLNVSVLFSCELGCWPPGLNCSKYPHPDPNVFPPEKWEPLLDRARVLSGLSGDYHYLNSGGIMGTVQGLIDAVEFALTVNPGDEIWTEQAFLIAEEKLEHRINTEYWRDDQLRYILYFLTYGKEKRVAIDYYGDIFASGHGLKAEAMKGDRNSLSIFHRVLNRSICVLHGNGYSKDWFYSLANSCQPKQDGTDPFLQAREKKERA